MKFKNHKQRKAVMMKLTYNQLRNKGIKLHPYKDSDKDGVKNNYNKALIKKFPVFLMVK